MSKIHEYSETDFRDLIRRFLIETGSFPGDLRGVTFRLEYHPNLKLEFDRRLLTGKKAWEGITWVLDLLSHRPYRNNVGLKHLKELLGTVTDRKATKGVLVTPGKFTRYAITKAKLNPQIELLGGLALQNLLTQHLGARWLVNLDSLIMKGTRS